MQFEFYSISRNFLIILSILYSVHCQSQSNIVWQNTLGGSKNDALHHMITARNGNIILSGYSQSNISGDISENSRGIIDYWISEINKNDGKLIWQKTIGGSYFDLANSTIETSDGGYLIGGYSNSNISGEKSENSRGKDDYWVVKLDSQRNILWDRTYGGDDTDRLFSVLETNDGGYILVGESQSNISGEKSENSRGITDMWIVKINSLGDIEWQRTIGGSQRDSAKKIIKAHDGGYIIGGSSMSDISGEKTENSRSSFLVADYWILKIDESGDIKWQKTIGGNNGDNLSSLKPTTNGNYIVGGTSGSNISSEKSENSVCNSVDAWVLKLDKNGNVLWQKTLGGDSTDWESYVSETNDNGFIVGISTSSNTSGNKSEDNPGERNFWLVKLNSEGTIEWDKTIGGTETDQLNSVLAASDGSYIFGGWSTSNASGDKSENTNGGWDQWIVKLQMNSINESSETYSTLTSCLGSSISLSTEAGTSYKWSGPNNFTSTEPTPAIQNVSEINAGIYRVSVYSDAMCFNSYAIKLELNSLNPIKIADVLSCDTVNDGYSNFNLMAMDQEIKVSNTGITVDYYGENGDKIPKPLPVSYTNSKPSEELITARVSFDNSANCVTETTFKLISEFCEEEPEFIGDLKIPKFFTPNNDGYNDKWIIKGNSIRNSSPIQIFDRYGKLLKQLDPMGNGWDGTFNGKEMPSDDYWFQFNFTNGNYYHGNFSLIRSLQ
ncbi:T9SS type B sorting domain-containing protein [Gillisia sp. JM1]|uniref:T9SS type B sorting domain-containing protein n=1 Tax=Gillisia sp. JM1 TaxID=1283286 RepID=UPI0003FDF979|nr:T9SS type B sorting domain-containing protein [Gillisia sp. JM1]